MAAAEGPGRRGGILLDLFWIVILVGLGAAAWLAFTSGRLEIKVPPFARRYFPSTASSSVKDAGEKSAWLQTLVRDKLSVYGLNESSVLKAFTRERRDEGVKWLENTLEISSPKSFNGVDFLQSLIPEMEPRGVRVTKNLVEHRRWIVEFGAGSRVYQRIIFRQREGK